MGVNDPPRNDSRLSFNDHSIIDNDGQDNAMMQALQTLSGNLTPMQMQQIQMQLARNRPAPPTAANQWDKKPSRPSHGIVVPPRGYASTNTSPSQKHKPEPPSRSAGSSPTQTNGGDSPVRSALLEEFRTNKNRKYELAVYFTNFRILALISLNLAVINMDLVSSNKNWKFVPLKKSN
jgi:hypothetical protein